MKNKPFKYIVNFCVLMLLFFSVNLLSSDLKAENQKLFFNCDTKDKEFPSQLSLELNPDNLFALETTKSEKKSFRVLKEKRILTKIKDEEKDGRVHLWFSLVDLKGDFKAFDDVPASKNNQEALLIYLSYPKNEKAKLDIYVNRLFYSQEKSETVDYRGTCKVTKTFNKEPNNG